MNENVFDLKARDWDNNPIHWERSEAIANAILKHVSLSNNTTAIEFGAGTGILSFMLKDYLKSIIMIDSSSEMVKVMQDKVDKANIKNLCPLHANLEIDDYTGNKVHFIFSQMVFHHVKDIESLVSKLFKILHKKGYIAIADLFPEDGSFHSGEFDGHKGIDVNWLEDILSKTGFSNIHTFPVYTIRRVDNENKLHEYPVFFMIGKK